MQMAVLVAVLALPHWIDNQLHETIPVKIGGNSI